MEEAEDVGFEVVQLKEQEEIAQWIVVQSIGVGAFGEVYRVINRDDDTEGAMKIESMEATDRILKIELEVLKKLWKEGNSAMRLLGFGTNERFSYVIMTLCGQDLSALRLQVPEFSASTLLRVALRSLLSLKELHEVGYIHRDIKPANCSSSLDGSRKIFLIDFGMVRLYAKKDKSKGWELKKKRPTVPFRGTLRYCSITTHERQEQGRVDDLWGWFYMCVEFRRPLPWRRFENPDKVHHEKMQCSPRQLLGGDEDVILSKWEAIFRHLKELGVDSRPNYRLIADIFEAQIKEHGHRLSDPYDWDDETKDSLTVEKINDIYRKFDIKRPKRRLSQLEKRKTELEEWREIRASLEPKTTDVPGGEETRPRAAATTAENMPTGKSVMLPSTYVRKL